METVTIFNATALLNLQELIAKLQCWLAIVTLAKTTVFDRTMAAFPMFFANVQVLTTVLIANLRNHAILRHARTEALV